MIVVLGIVRLTIIRKMITMKGIKSNAGDAKKR